MDKIEFQKFSGSGNDFIIIDNRDLINGIKNRKELAQKLCQRKLSVGADGVIFLENSNVADFKMRLFQPDGSEAEMCGNGARCLAKFAYINGITKTEMNFETMAGIIESKIVEKNVMIKLTEPENFRFDKIVELKSGDKYNYNFVNTGVPHTVISCDDIEVVEIKKIGNEIRFHNDFKPDGTNVNFIEVDKNNNIVKIRTYERGVEDETLACGTGSVASALISSIKFNLNNPVTVITRSGFKLIIHFEEKLLKEINNDIVKSDVQLNVFLEGDANLIFSGTLN